MKMTVKDIDVTGKKILVRVDFNVPLKNGEVADDNRIRSAMPTIKYLKEHQAKIILVSHLGRPKGKVIDEMRLDPAAQCLSDMLGAEVHKVDMIIGDEVRYAVDCLGPGEILLLENVRFDPREEANDPEFARSLAELAEIYVNDAFGAAHRLHASTVGVTRFLPSVAGLLMAYELDNLHASINNPERPLAALLGGAKISDKIGVIEHFLNAADQLLIGGGMANTFLAAQGFDMADSLLDSGHISEAGRLLQLAEAKDKKIILPVDLVCAPDLKPGVEVRTVSPGNVPPGWKCLDIGLETVKEFSAVVKKAKTILWNGPMGAFEIEPFAIGSIGISRAIASSAGSSYAGGGDTGALIEMAGVTKSFTFVSTGGGASLRFWEGKTLPGVEALSNAGLYSVKNI